MTTTVSNASRDVQQPLRSRLAPSGGPGYVLTVPGEEAKAGLLLEFAFPAELVPWPERYLSCHRSYLCTLAEEHARPVGFRPAESHLWVSKIGSALGKARFYDQLCKLTAARFGRPIHPHLFHDCAATSTTNEDPDHSFIIKSVLGHSTLRTAERHYEHAKATQAVRQYQALVMELRRKFAGANKGGQNPRKRSPRKGGTKPKRADGDGKQTRKRALARAWAPVFGCGWSALLPDWLGAISYDIGCRTKPLLAFRRSDKHLQVHPFSPAGTY